MQTKCDLALTLFQLSLKSQKYNSSRLALAHSINLCAPSSDILQVCLNHVLCNSKTRDTRYLLFTTRLAAASHTYDTIFPWTAIYLYLWCLFQLELLKRVAMARVTITKELQSPNQSLPCSFLSYSLFFHSFKMPVKSRVCFSICHVIY